MRACLCPSRPRCSFAAPMCAAPSSAAASFLPPPLRVRERALLRSLLRPSPQLSPLLISGPAQSGKRELVLSVLAENGALFAYASGRTAHVDKRWISRITEQIARRQEKQAETQGEADGGNDTTGKGKQGRKKRKIGVGGAAVVDTADEVDDDAIQLPSESAGQKRKSDGGGAASATAAASAMSLDAVAASALTSPPRAQLVELVRTVVGLRVTHEKMQLAAAAAAAAAATAAGSGAASAAPAVPPTLFLVFSEPARIQAAHPGLFASLLELTSHTCYPVTLVLLHRSLSGDCATDGAASLWGMADAHAAMFMRLTFAPYTSEQKAQILAERLWTTHESCAEANLALITAVSPRLSSTQAASTAYEAWTSFCAMILPVFQGAMVGGGPLRDYEMVLRQIVPAYVEALQRRTRAALHRGGGGARKIDPSELSASLLGELRPIVQALMGNLHQNQAGLALTQVAASAGGRGVHPARYSLLGSMAFSAASAAAVSSASPAAAAALPSSFPDLCRTSRLLLMASFLGSYNPASADRTRFTHGRSTKSNRRGKSATMDRAGSGIGKSSAAQVSQLSLGPQWVSLDRLLAIFHVLNQDDAGSDAAEGENAQQLNEEAGDLAAYERAVKREDPAGSSISQQNGGASSSSSFASSVGRFSQSSCFQLLSSLCAAFALECSASSSTSGSFAAAASTAGTLGITAKIASGAAATSAASGSGGGWGSASTTANGDMLASMRVRCLLSYDQVSAILAAGAGASHKAEAAAGRAAPSGSGATLSLDAYLYDQTTANGRGRSAASKQRATK